MKVDYERLKQSVAEIIREVEHGEKNPIRRPGVQLRVVRDLQGEVTAGPFTYRTDAALDAGGFAEHPRPMDYVLGALASCQQMWCLRWAAQNNVVLTDLVIEAESVFSWRGEYLQEVDAGMNELHVCYQVAGVDLTKDAACDMADTVARRCPVFATLRRAVVIKEQIKIAGCAVVVREWTPGIAKAALVSGV
jgi:uncharacterized OsmC-like protein